jgi:hypothetical protein
MSQSVDGFVTEQKALLKGFLAYWKRANALNPKLFPARFETGNEGLWHEQFDYFCAHGGMTDEQIKKLDDK